MKSYTKEFMVEALKKLLHTKPINKITINDIVGECNASKQTFYNHFQDKYDLFNYTLTTVLNQNLEDSARDSDDFKTTIFNYFVCVLEEKDFYRSIIRDNTARDLIFECISEYSASYFREKARNALGTDAIAPELELAIRFDAVGNANLVAEWIYGGMEVSPETMAEVAYHCIPDCLRQYQ